MEMCQNKETYYNEADFLKCHQKLKPNIHECD